MIQLKLFFQITIPIRFHSIFFTPQLPGQKRLKIYWPSKTDWKILSSLKFEDNEEELKLLDEYEKNFYQKNKKEIKYILKPKSLL